jgi:glutamyl/glutaminyl-tRNA synthetase
MNKEDYNGYKAKGGTLVQEYYELAIEFSENGWKLLSEEADIFSCTSILASFSQARHMAHYAEIELTEVEKLMYVFLRIRPLEENIEDTQVVARGNRGIEKAIESLNRVTQRNENPEAGEQIRSMVQVHEQVQARTETALQQMTQRKAALKLLIGPDYKNAGQVRSDVVGLRNDIRQLTRIQEDSSTEDAGDVQGAIDELEAEANELETQLEEELSGFSLFGWLSRLLANY